MVDCAVSVEPGVVWVDGTFDEELVVDRIVSVEDESMVV